MGLFLIVTEGIALLMVGKSNLLNAVVIVGKANGVFAVTEQNAVKVLNLLLEIGLFGDPDGLAEFGNHGGSGNGGRGVGADGGGRVVGCVGVHSLYPCLCVCCVLGVP